MEGAWNAQNDTKSLQNDNGRNFAKNYNKNNKTIIYNFQNDIELHRMIIVAKILILTHLTL